MIIAIISGTIAVIALIILVIKIKSDKLNIYKIRIEEAEKEIQILLEKKLSLLGILQKKLSEESSEVEFNFLCDLNDVDDDEFKLNTILNKAQKELKDFLDDKRSYIPDDEIKTLLDDLSKVDIECTATKNYYNDNVLLLNNKSKKFLNNIISKSKGIYRKELYNDPVEEEFEILKKK